MPPAAAATVATPTELAALGRRLFFDPNLSASRRQSCATCHDPQHAYAPSNARAVQFGGANLDTPGLRAVPSLRYALRRTPRWSKQYQSSPVERLLETDSVPVGGFGWDGRFDSLHEQALFPLLAANEMGNRSVHDVAEKLRGAAYSIALRRLVGDDAFADDAKIVAAALLAIERFELDDPSFAPYTSRFDRFLDGKLALSAQEQRGYRLFIDPAKGNCASCHIAQKGADGSHPLFTDFSFEAIGVARNFEVSANADPNFYDLGLCGPVRSDQRGQKAYCGMFKTSSLRNVATRGALFHNGRFHDLRQALLFYVSRDLHADRWYPRIANTIARYDDLPPDLRDNVDVIDAPFDRKPGQAPVWNEQQIDDVIAFLQTLTDEDVAR